MLLWFIFILCLAKKYFTSRSKTKRAQTRELISAPRWRKRACSSSGIFLLSARQDGISAKNNDPIANARDIDNQTKENITEEPTLRRQVKERANLGFN